MRAYGGRVFRLADHLDRLKQSASRIGLPLPEGLAAAVQETVSANGIAEAAVRLTASRGLGPGLEPPDPAEPTVVIAVRPAPTAPALVRAGLARGRLNERAPTAGLKRLGYLDAIVELRAARAAGYDDVVFLDTAGHLAEGAYSNLILWAGDAVRTPPLSCGVLPGITRQTVLEIARDAGHEVAEEPLDPAVLQAAEEAFLTSSIREIAPLVAVSGRPLGRGEPGSLTRRIQQAYAARTRAAE